MHSLIPSQHSTRQFLAAAALAIFCIGVLPVLGFVPFDFQQFSTTADHYLYLSMLGPAMGAAFAFAALGEWHRRPAGGPASGSTAGAAVSQIQSPQFQFFTFHSFSFSRFTFHVFTFPGALKAARTLCIVLLAALGMRTFFQARHWHDSFSLLEHAIAVNPWSPLLYDNLSKAYADAGLPDEARRWDEQSVRRWPDRAAGHLDLASDFLALNRPAQAEAQFETVLRLDPTFDAARQQLAELRRRSAATSRPTP